MPFTGTLREIRERLMSERGDPGMVRHTQAEYERAILEAVQDAPRELWPLVEDMSLTTQAGQVCYELVDMDNYQDCTPERADDILAVFLKPALTTGTAYMDWTPVGFQVYESDCEAGGGPQ